MEITLSQRRVLLEDDYNLVLSVVGSLYGMFLNIDVIVK